MASGFIAPSLLVGILLNILIFITVDIFKHTAKKIRKLNDQMVYGTTLKASFINDKQLMMHTVLPTSNNTAPSIGTIAGLIYLLYQVYQTMKLCMLKQVSIQEK